MERLSDLRKFVCPEIIFGNGARLLAGRYAKQIGAKKIFLVTDEGIMQTSLIKDVINSIENEDIPYTIFSDVTPNPRHTEVLEGAKQYLKSGSNLIVSVGGGSPMDCAKGIGVVATHHANILDFEGIDKIRVPVPPLIFIPTTAGSSADVSQFCIISNQERKVKIAIVSKAIVPDVALIDPIATYSMGSYLTACTGMDTLVHAIEAYVSKGAGVLTDVHALDAIRLVHENLNPLINDLTNQELRSKMMLASMKAGLAFSNAILGAVHAMAHSLGGFLDLPHGECNALLLPHVVNYNFDSSPERFIEIAKVLEIPTKNVSRTKIQKELVAHLIEMKSKVGILDGLSKRKVNISDVPILSEKALNDACMVTNPKSATKSDVEVIFKEAF
jgi:alcohol dehydrogenase class IV